jgi:hypothetical protein
MIKTTGTRKVAQKWLSEIFFGRASGATHVWKLLRVNALRAEPATGFEPVTC